MRKLLNLQFFFTIAATLFCFSRSNPRQFRDGELTKVVDYTVSSSVVKAGSVVFAYLGSDDPAGLFSRFCSRFCRPCSRKASIMACLLAAIALFPCE
jgi:hypothetical protein